MPLEAIIDLVRGEEAVYIQTHNYPDHDAVASAMGLQHLLAQFDVTTHILYEGDIQRDSLKRMIRELAIRIRPAADHALEAEDMIIIVDGCKGNRNVTDLAGREIAVIDHHNVVHPEDVPCLDIRPDYGACATIICEYYKTMGVDIPEDVATALMIGINTDTALLTRGVSEADIQAYSELFAIADTRLQNSILRNQIETKDLDFFRHAIDHVDFIGACAFCHFPQGCNQNLLGILADFLLALREVDFVVLCATNQGVVNFSVRSELECWNASLLTQEILRGIGFGGGHADMAGGIIRDVTLFDPKSIRGRFLERLHEEAAKANLTCPTM